MTRFLTGTDLYERVALRENEFESLVPRYWSRLAPGWTLFPWKPLVAGPGGRARPDAVAFHETGSRWSVVEVELASHPDSHFRNQFEALALANYGRHLLDGLVETVGEGRAARVESLVTSNPPEFLCIVDEANDKIVSACRDFGFDIAVLVPHRSLRGDYGFTVARMPPHYTDVEPVARYELTVGEGLWGGRLSAVVPVHFPTLAEIVVRHAGQATRTRVMAAGGVRRMFLPPDFRLQGRPPALEAIDPAHGLYELS